jgi:hypothetical protein
VDAGVGTAAYEELQRGEVAEAHDSAAAILESAREDGGGEETGQELVAVVFGGGEHPTSYYNDVHLLVIEKKRWLRQGSSHVGPLAATVSRQFNNPAWNDVSFLVDSKLLHLHRALLAPRSAYFRQLFRSGMRESAQASDGEGGAAAPIPIQDISYELFEKLMRFLYTDQLELTPENVFEVCAAANRFALDDVLQRCERYLLQAMLGDRADEEHELLASKTQPLTAEPLRPTSDPVQLVLSSDSEAALNLRSTKASLTS